MSPHSAVSPPGSVLHDDLQPRKPLGGISQSPCNDLPEEWISLNTISRSNTHYYDPGSSDDRED